MIRSAGNAQNLVRTSGSISAHALPRTGGSLAAAASARPRSLASNAAANCATGTKSYGFAVSAQYCCRAQKRWRELHISVQLNHRSQALSNTATNWRLRLSSRCGILQEWDVILLSFKPLPKAIRMRRLADLLGSCSCQHIQKGHECTHCSANFLLCHGQGFRTIINRTMGTLSQSYESHWVWERAHACSWPAHWPMGGWSPQDKGRPAVINSDSFCWISCEYCLNEILSICWYKFRDGVFSIHYFFV